MLDRLGRNIDYIRISITDRCNLRCIYCMPDEKIQTVSRQEMLSFEEIEYICSLLVKMGIKKVKITGGEPLVRPNCHLLIKRLKELPGIQEVTLTTNGILLKDQIKQLSKAGLDAVNISLDTLNEQKYREITRGGNINRVMEGIHETLKYPNILLKINCVPVHADKENILTIAKLAQKYPIHVRFIEMMPIGYGKKFPFCSEETIRKMIEEEYGTIKKNEIVLGNGPSVYGSVDGFKGKIGFISALSHKFCDKCNRVRLTSDGFLKICLQYDIGIDLKETLRNKKDEKYIFDIIYKTIYNKPLGHHFVEKTDDQSEETKGMSQIGG